MSEICDLSNRLILIYVIVSITVFQSGVDFQMSMFMYYPPKHFCQYPNETGASASADNCQYSLTKNNTVTKYLCQSWTFDNSQIQSTIVTELSLVCQYQYLQLLLIPVRQLSSILTVLFAFLSDIRGRKIMFLITIMFDSIIWLLLGIVPTNYLSHVILRSMKAAFSAAPQIGIVLVSELTPTKYRNVIIINYWVPFSLGLVVAPFYIWMTLQWRSAWLLSSIPNICYLAAPFIILESPYWLRTKNRNAEAEEISNKLQVNFFQEELEHIVEEQKNEEEFQFCKELKLITLSCRMVTRIGVLFFTSFSFYLVYQGLSTDFSFATQNIYINAFALGLVELPSGPISSMCSEYFGSVSSTVLGLFFTLIFYSIYGGLQTSVSSPTVTSNIAKLILACLIRFMICGAWNVQSIFYLTLIPTTLRNFFNNFGEIFGKVGAGLGGFLGYYIIGQFMVATTLFCTLLLISMLLIGLIIPQSDDRILPQMAEDAKKIEKDFRCCKSETEL